MKVSSELWVATLAVGSFLLGSLAPIFTRAIAERLKIRSRTGPVIIKRKGTEETAVIPDHYDPAAVDLLIRQLKTPSFSRNPARMHA